MEAALAGLRFVCFVFSSDFVLESPARHVGVHALVIHFPFLQFQIASVSPQTAQARPRLNIRSLIAKRTSKRHQIEPLRLREPHILLAQNVIDCLKATPNFLG